MSNNIINNNFSNMNAVCVGEEFNTNNISEIALQPKRKYPITDSVSAALLIDLPIYAVLLINDPMSMEQKILKAGTGTLSAAGAYLIRSFAREAGHEYIGGILGGMFKYGIRLNQDGLHDYAMQGGINNLGYEIAKNYNITNIISDYGGMMGIEVIDEVVGYSLKNANVIKETIEARNFNGFADKTASILTDGTYAGFITAAAYYFIFSNVISHVHDVVDCAHPAEEVNISSMLNGAINSPYCVAEKAVNLFTIDYMYKVATEYIPDVADKLIADASEIIGTAVDYPLSVMAGYLFFGENVEL